MYSFYTKKLCAPTRHIHKLLLIMRLTTIILITAIMQVSANSFAQKITLSEKNTSLYKVFEKIRAQSGFDFLCTKSMLRDTKPVSITVKDAPLQDVLKDIFQNQPVIYELKNNAVVVSRKEKSSLENAYAIIEGIMKDITVTGTVLDEKGQALPGATIKLKEDSTKIAAITGSNGRFSLRVPDNSTVLLISYVGYKTKEVRISGTDLVVRMELGSGELEGVTVVSTGYQKIPKERATGSFEKVDNQLFNRTTGTDVISRLYGNVPSLYNNIRVGSVPNGSDRVSALTIRGISSLSGARPLVVLDNIAYEGDVNNINPNDVEDITILKDAAAASIWGARAGNGVIVITTKKGRYERPLNVSFNTNFTVSAKPDLFYIPQISSSDFIDVEKFLYAQKFYDSKITNTSPYPSFLTPVVSILAKQTAGTLTSTEANAQIDALRQYDVRNDYEKYVYRKQFNQQYALSLSGGTKQSNYFVSGGFDRNLNSLVTSKYDRITLRSDYNFSPIKPLEVQTGIIYSQNKTRDIGGNSVVDYRTGLLSSIYPYARLTDDQGNPTEPGYLYNLDYLNGLNNNPNLLNWHYKPLEDINKSSVQGISEDIIFNLGTTYTFNSILSADVKYQYQTTNTNSATIYNADSYFVRDKINTYTNPTNFSRAIPVGGIYLPVHGRSTGQIIRGQLNANKTWNEKHQLIAIAGAEIRKNYGEGNSEGYRYGYAPNTKTFKTVDYLNSQIPLYYGGVGQILYDASFGSSDNRFTSLFANASYTYDNRYVISASARKDASNVFGTATNRKGSPLWSAGASWNISNESFYKSELIPYLKFRTTYGFSGNTITGVPAFAVVTQGINSLTQLPYARPTSLPNPDLRWEKVGMLNFGLDFSSKSNRLTGSFEYYDKRSTDILASAPIDPSTGFTTQKYNTANLHGKGMDIRLTSINLKTTDFQWNTSFLFSYNKNTVTRYLLPQSNASTYIALSGGINPIEGKDAYAVLSYPYAGLDSIIGDPQGYLNGQISKNYTAIFNGKVSDLQFFGSSMPIYFGSLRNDFTYHGFTISANIIYKFDYFFRRQGINYTNLYFANFGDAEFTNRWQKTGDEMYTNVPSMIYPANQNRDTFYNSSAAVIEKGDHIRLQDITTSYTFKKIKGLQNCKVYANVSNIGIIWRANNKGIDPDISSSYPTPRTLSIGLSTNF